MILLLLLLLLPPLLSVLFVFALWLHADILQLCVWILWCESWIFALLASSSMHNSNRQTLH